MGLILCTVSERKDSNQGYINTCLQGYDLVQQESYSHCLKSCKRNQAVFSLEIRQKSQQLRNWKVLILSDGPLK